MATTRPVKLVALVREPVSRVVSRVTEKLSFRGLVESQVNKPSEADASLVDADDKLKRMFTAVGHKLAAMIHNTRTQQTARGPRASAELGEYADLRACLDRHPPPPADYLPEGLGGGRRPLGPGRRQQEEHGGADDAETTRGRRALAAASPLVSDAALVSQLEHSAKCAFWSPLLGHSLYGITLRNWAAHFAPGTLLVQRTEDLAADPLRVVRNVLTHVGADASLIADEDAAKFHTRFNPSTCLRRTDKYRPGWNKICAEDSQADGAKPPLDVAAYAQLVQPPWWRELAAFYATPGYEWHEFPYHGNASAPKTTT